MKTGMILAVVAAAVGLAVLSGCATCESSAACPAACASPCCGAQKAYECRFASGAITVDGKLDEPAWAEAVVITDFNAFQPADAEVLSPTKARLLWDDQNIYLAVECEDKDIWSYSDVDDDELWNGDVAEFFIKPCVKRPLYYEFVVAPSGALYDGFYPSRGSGGYNRFKGWSSDAQVGVSVQGTDGDWTDDDEGYVVEMAIPASAIPEDLRPAEGITWTFGVFRYDYTKCYEKPLLLMSIPEAVTAGFHSYEGYEPLVFVKGGK